MALESRDSMGKHFSSKWHGSKFKRTAVAGLEKMPFSSLLSESNRYETHKKINKKVLKCQKEWEWCDKFKNVHHKKTMEKMMGEVFLEM